MRKKNLQYFCSYFVENRESQIPTIADNVGTARVKGVYRDSHKSIKMFMCATKCVALTR